MVKRIIDYFTHDCSLQKNQHVIVVEELKRKFLKESDHE